MSGSRTSGGNEVAAPEPHVLRFTMPSRRDAVAPSVDRILAAAQAADLTADQSDDLAVALSEALANAAVHGNRLAADRAVDVVVTTRAHDSVVIEVGDEGGGFDVGAVRDPTAEEHRLVPGGRGVFLMRRLVDDLEYNRTGNRVTLNLPLLQRQFELD